MTIGIADHGWTVRELLRGLGAERQTRCQKDSPTRESCKKVRLAAASQNPEWSDASHKLIKYDLVLRPKTVNIC
jgi:hypothetical protein